MLFFHFILALKLSLTLLTPSGQFSRFDKKLVLAQILIFNVAIKYVILLKLIRNSVLKIYNFFKTFESSFEQLSKVSRIIWCLVPLSSGILEFQFIHRFFSIFITHKIFNIVCISRLLNFFLLLDELFHFQLS